MADSYTRTQREAIEHHTGPLLVLAGAGSGKTTVLVQRIVHLIKNHGVVPEDILALTYTNNAAANLHDRVQEALGREIDISGLRGCTFHSYCAELLKRHRKSFDVLDAMDLKVYLNMNVHELPLRLFTKAASPGQFIEDLLTFNSRCQDDLITVEDYRKYVSRLESDRSLPLPRVGTAKLMDDMPREEVISRCHEIAEVYEWVGARLREKGWGTYGNMVVDAVALLQDESILEQERSKTKFILIDEFQDSNHGQIELAHLLARSNGNIFAVGDPDQAIYCFRGATNQAFEEFKLRFDPVKMVTLDHNFRSVPAILNTAFAAISKNESADRRPLISGRAELASEKAPLPKSIPEIWLVPDFFSEAKAIADSVIAKKKEEGLRWSDFAVLYRQHTHRTEVASEFASRGIPHDVKGVDLLTTPDVRDLLASIRVVLMPDDSVSWFRLAAVPQVGIEASALKSALSAAKRGTSFQAILLEVKGGKNLLATVKRVRDQIADMKLLTTSAIDLLIKIFRFRKSVALDGFHAFAEAWQKKAIADSKRLEGFCEYMECYQQLGGKVCLELSQTGEKNAVQMMTVHGAKGLEFKSVYVVRIGPSSFPSNNREPLFEFPEELSRAKTKISDSSQTHHEEERRLFYVAITRAQDFLYLSTKPRGKQGKPSGYCKELLEGKIIPSLRQRTIESFSVDIQAAASAMTPLAAWLLAPSKPPEQPIVLSASAIETYNACPLKYKIEREWKLPGELSASQQYGSVVHSVLRGYYEAIRSGKRLDLEMVLLSFNTQMLNAKIQDAHQLGLYLQQGKRHLTEFVRTHEQMSPHVIATEKEFEFEVNGVRVKGRFDRVDEASANGVAIEDYKTGSARTQKHADESMQLSIYALAAERSGKLAEKLSFYNLEDDSTVVTHRSQDELREVAEKISEIAMGIRTGKFDANPDYHCRWCAYASICPEKEEQLINIARAAGGIQ